MSTELLMPERRELTPMDLIQIAIEKEGSVDVIERLTKLQLDIQDRNDRVAFTRAMSEFKDNVPVIIRNRVIRDKDGAEKYKAVALEDVAGPIMKGLSERRITYRFKTADLPGGLIRVTCFLRLEGTAYEEEGSSLAAPPDTSGGKDHLKGVGSTVSYLEKFTLLASIGVHVHSTDPEAVPVDGVTQDDADGWIENIREADTPESVMAIWTKAIAFSKSFTPIDYKAMTIFTDARDERLKQLRRAK